MMTLSTTNAFDCEKECKKQQDCFFFNFSERDGVCELYESEFRHGCHDLSGPLVSSLNIEVNIEVQTLVGFVSKLSKS